MPLVTRLVVTQLGPHVDCPDPWLVEVDLAGAVATRRRSSGTTRAGCTTARVGGACRPGRRGRAGGAACSSPDYCDTPGPVLGKR